MLINRDKNVSEVFFHSTLQTFALAQTDLRVNKLLPEQYAIF
jgi:hypothetical protein